MSTSNRYSPHLCDAVEVGLLGTLKYCTMGPGTYVRAVSNDGARNYLLLSLAVVGDCAKCLFLSFFPLFNLTRHGANARISVP
jgi:hypothetical protein